MPCVITVTSASETRSQKKCQLLDGVSGECCRKEKFVKIVAFKSS